MSNPPYMPQFYAPWMKLGTKKAMHQLEEIRTDTVNLLPIVRAVGFDDSPVNWTKDHAVQAWEVGEKNFKNKFRIYWDKSATRFKIQRNSGTEASPTWVDSLSISSSSVIYDTNGNVIGGPGSTSTVTWTDGVNTYVKNKLNVNGAQFYLSNDLSGNPVLNFFGSSSGGSTVDGASNVNVGGVGVFKQLSGTTLQFKGVNAGSSKISVTDDSGNNEIDVDVVQANLDHGSIGGLTDDDHTQYTLVAGTRAFTGDQSMGGNKLTNVGAPSAGTDAARLQDIGPGFYGIIVKESDNSVVLRDDTISFVSSDFDVTDTNNKPQVAISSSVARLTDVGPGFYGITIKQSNNTKSFKGINVVSFNAFDFYIKQNSPNTDEVVINLRAIITGDTMVIASGNVAHDDVDSGNPVKIGGRADTTFQPAVADADRVDALFDVYGQIRSRTDHANLWSYHENSSSALTDATVQAAPGAGLSLYVTDIICSTGAATAWNVFFEEGSTTVLGPYYLEATAGRGFVMKFKTPKKITVNTALTVTTSAAIAHAIDVMGFIAP